MNTIHMNNSNDIEINDEINQQLDKLSVFSVKDYKLVNKELSLLKKNREFIDRKEYLIKLLELRDRLTI